MALSKEATDLRNVLQAVGVQCEATVPALMSAAAHFIETAGRPALVVEHSSGAQFDVRVSKPARTKKAK